MSAACWNKPVCNMSDTGLSMEPRDDCWSTYGWLCSRNARRRGYMSLVGRLDLTQLEIIMHLANGRQLDEIAISMHRSKTDVNRRLALARKRCQATTIPHLVSIAIATGDLVWQDEQRTLNGNGNEQRTLNGNSNGHVSL